MAEELPRLRIENVQPNVSLALLAGERVTVHNGVDVIASFLVLPGNAVKKDNAALPSPLPNEGDGREALVRPINEAPKHRDLFVYREDAGWMMARHTCMTEFMTDAEIDSTEMSEFDLHEDDWFAYSQDGVYRLSNDGLPTLFVDPAALSQLTPAK